MFEDIDFSPGKIIYFDFHINSELPLSPEYNPNLDEDMIVISYPYSIMLDIGWYKVVNQFIVCVVKKQNWDNPIIKKKCENLDLLEITIRECIDQIKAMIQEENKRQRFKSMVSEEVNFSPGIIDYNDFVYINPNIPLKEQTLLLKENMMLIAYYDRKYTIEAGWYPEMDPLGKFKVEVLKFSDLDTPLYSKETNDIKKLCKYVKECMKTIKKLGSESD
jgi:hypothetical protein